MARTRRGRRGCQVCGGTGLAQAKAMGGPLNGTFHMVPCFECFPPPIVGVSTAYKTDESMEVGALRPALDAVRAARRNGEA